MKKILLLFLIALVVGVGFYIFLAPNSSVRSRGSLSQGSPTSAANEPIAEAPVVVTPASTPFPSRNVWPREVTLKKQEVFTQNVGNGVIKTALPAGTVVQIQDIVAGMLTAKRGGMTTHLNIEDTDFADRVERIRGPVKSTPAAPVANNEASMPAGQTAGSSKPPAALVSQNHHATPVAPVPTPADTLPPAAPANNSGVIGCYNGLATGNIMVVASPSTAPGTHPNRASNDSGPGPHGGKIMEVRLSENSVAEEPAQVEFFIVVKSRGSHEFIVSKSGTQDPSNPGRWTFDMGVEQPPAIISPVSAPDAGHGNESRVLGWFVRAIRDGRIIGYCASSFNYEQYAMNPTMVNTSPAK